MQVISSIPLFVQYSDINYIEEIKYLKSQTVVPGADGFSSVSLGFIIFSLKNIS